MVSTPATDATSVDGANAAAIVLIVVGALAGIVFALVQYLAIRKIEVKLDALEGQNGSEQESGDSHASEHMVTYDDQGAQAESGVLSNEEKEKKLIEISTAIQLGARSFLKAEYKYCAVFIAVFGLALLLLLGFPEICGAGHKESCWADSGFTFLAFVIGGVTSMLCGYIGMTVAVFTNVRTTIEATRGYQKAFNAAFRGGAVMGFALSGTALLILFILIVLYKIHFETIEDPEDENAYYLFLFEAVAGYGLGGSCIALFGRVGGGIYTKAADVGADLVGKVDMGIPEDDPRNPATIADNVGDNVGDIAGMGADLFGSFAESTCAALVLSATSTQLSSNFSTMLFPLVVSAIGIMVCILTSFLATRNGSVKEEKDIERALTMQLILSTVILTFALLLVTWLFLPGTFFIKESPIEYHWWGIYLCLFTGLWAGLGTGLVTDYYTSHSHRPVREVAESTKQGGAATLVIYGLALGYKSTVIPVILLAITVFTSFFLGGLYGVAMAALGMLSSLSIGLTIDAYGPITDNAGGIAEMAEMGKHIRDITDALDAAGNTTAAVGKGFAIGSAALVSLALYGAYVTRVVESSPASEKLEVKDLGNVLQPLTFAFLLQGAMIPYAFSAMTMKSVGLAAKEMVEEVKNQFATIPGIMEGTAKPDYDRCVSISTKASLREMIAPGVLVISYPIITGYLFGVFALSGLLAGSLVSSVQLALSASNTGGAWDNAKKYIEANHDESLGGKGSEFHKAAVVGDTVGDPLKDTSGPSLNIVMKLMAIISLVFANSFVDYSVAKGRWAGYP